MDKSDIKARNNKDGVRHVPDTHDLLLHVCCGPCAEYPLEVLIDQEGFRPLLYFYNPNIHPREEWRRRLHNLLLLAEKRGLSVIVEPDWDQEQWTGYDPSEQGGLTRENGQKFREAILSRGNSTDLAELYRNWRGHDPKIEPLLEQRGLDSK